MKAPPDMDAALDYFEQRFGLVLPTTDLIGMDAYYEEKAPEKEGGEPSYEVIEPPPGAMVPYLPEGAVEKEIGGETYFIAGSAFCKAVYSGSDVLYQVVEDPQA